MLKNEPSRVVEPLWYEAIEFLDIPPMYESVEVMDRAARRQHGALAGS